MSFLAAPNRVPLADIPSVAFYFYHFSPSFSLFRAYILPFSRKSLRDLSKTARRFSTGEIISFATKGEDYILTRFDNKRFFLRKKGEEREKNCRPKLYLRDSWRFFGEKLFPEEFGNL